MTVWPSAMYPCARIVNRRDVRWIAVSAPLQCSLAHVTQLAEDRLEQVSHENGRDNIGAGSVCEDCNLNCADKQCNLHSVELLTPCTTPTLSTPASVKLQCACHPAVRSMPQYICCVTRWAASGGYHPNQIPRQQFIHRGAQPRVTGAGLSPRCEDDPTDRTSHQPRPFQSPSHTGQAFALTRNRKHNKQFGCSPSARMTDLL